MAGLFNRIKGACCLCTHHKENTGPGHQCVIYKLCLCLSLVLLVISSVFTLTSILAKIHTDMVWDRLEEDIQEENEKNFQNKHLSMNQIKLYNSQDSILVFKVFVMLAMTMGLANVLGLLLAIYGVLHHKHTVLQPFLAIGLLSLTSGVVLIYGMNDNFIPNLNMSAYALLTVCGGYLFFLPCWFIIYYHYLYLKAVHKKKGSLPISKSVVGAGGYIHTFDATEVKQKIPVV